MDFVAMRPIHPDHPTGAALLDVARHALLDEVAPSLSGRQRYVALMVANAVGIAMREIEHAGATARAWESAMAHVDPASDNPLAALVGAIRGGRYDADLVLYGALLETTKVAAEVWKPGPAKK
jgi:hypothetical protein